MFKQISFIMTFIIILTSCNTLNIQFPEKDYFNLQFEEINIDSMMQEEQEKYYRYKNGIKDLYHVLEMNSEDGIYTVSNEMDIDVYINKYRKLPNNFRPKDLVEPKVNHYSPEGDEKRLMRKKAANALEKLFDRAQEDGFPLTAVSGFRSYERQTVIYQNQILNNGEEYANQYSAKPGHSEHQTGLTMDVASLNNPNDTLLLESFGETEEGKWLANHAHEHGFIIRYPKGKEKVTGYNYEPWHIRYVGEKLATKLYKEQLTLEEYFGYHY